MVRENAEVLSNEPVARRIFLMRLSAPQIAQACLPAQFLQAQTDPGLSPFLRRPFSFLRADREAGWVEILYDVVGAGTRRLSATPVGSTLSVLGPLGLPFSPPETERLLFVAGGIGLAPLAFLAWDDPERRGRMVFLMGAGTRDRMPPLSRLLPPDLEVHAATDDGSLGFRGVVTDMIAAHAVPGKTVVFTCGPRAMMARAAGIAAGLGLPCYASLEVHMACGFGACVGCAVECREADRPDRRFLRVCVEGPVVDAHAVVW